MSRNEDISLAQDCIAACKLLVTAEGSLKSRLESAKITLVPLAYNAPPEYNAELAAINGALTRLNSLSSDEMSELAGRIFDLTLGIYRDTLSD